MSKTKPLNTIKMLWIGSSLGKIELLAVTSFIQCGHQLELYTYQDITNVPEGVIVKDANRIVPQSQIFEHQGTGSVAAFADWFRYKLLYEQGGIWADTDVVCLKPLDIDKDFYFGKEDFGRYNNAVLKAEPGLELFEWLANQARSPNDYLPYDSTKERRRKFIRRHIKGNKPGHVKWGECGPDGLTRAVNYFDLHEGGLPYHYFYAIHPKCWDAFFDTTYSYVNDSETQTDGDVISRYFPDSYCLHLWNNMMKMSPQFNKDGAFAENSLIEQLKKKYGVTND